MSDQGFLTATLGTDNFAKLRDNAETSLGKARLKTVVVYTSGPQTLTNAADLVIADTTGGAFTVNLPAAPAAGDRVEFVLTSDAALLTVGRNGKTINGLSSDFLTKTVGVRYVFTYYSTGGDWKATTAYARKRIKRNTSGPVTISAHEADVWLCNGTFTINLPASPLDGEEYKVEQTAAASTTTVGRNGKTINGVAADDTLATQFLSKVYLWSRDENTWLT